MKRSLCWLAGLLACWLADEWLADCWQLKFYMPKTVIWDAWRVAPWSTILLIWGAQGAPRKTPGGPDLDFYMFWGGICDLMGFYFSDMFVNDRDFED